MKRFLPLLVAAVLLVTALPLNISAEDDMFTTVTLEYTGINTTRVENSLIIYRDRATTGTNTWGYEVVCDNEGTVIAVGGNNSAIPEGGFVLSAIGTRKQPLIDASELGMTVVIHEESRTFTIGFVRENIGKKYQVFINTYREKYIQNLTELRDFDVTAVERDFEELSAIKDEIVSAVNASNDALLKTKDAEFTQKCKKLSDDLVISTPVEARTLWLRIMTSKSEKVVESTVQQIVRFGFNSVCIEALFDNTMIVPMPEGSLFEQNPAFGGVDMLKLYIDEFHKYGIEVHLWMSCYRVGYKGTSNTSRSVGMKKPEWRCKGLSGTDVVKNEYGDAFFLNPALPEVKEFLLDTYRYFLENYDIDGFQLDYVRYPEVSGEVFGYDDYTKSEFLKATGLSAVPTNSSQRGWNDWTEFRAAYVTDLVESVKEMIDEIRPDVWFSCDVAPATLSSLPPTTCQDTKTWTDGCTVDIIYPMAYGTTDGVKRWTAETLALCDEYVYSVMGLRDNGHEIFAEQVQECRRAGASGSAFFSYSQYIDGGYIGKIDKTVYARSAVNPTSNAKAALIAQLEFASAKLGNFNTLRQKAYSLDPVYNNLDVEDVRDTVSTKAAEEINRVIKKLKNSSVKAMSKDLRSLSSKLEELSGKIKYADGEFKVMRRFQEGLRDFLKENAHFINLLVNTSKDYEKAVYNGEIVEPDESSQDDTGTSESAPETSGSAESEPSADTSETVSEESEPIESEPVESVDESQAESSPAESGEESAPGNSVEDSAVGPESKPEGSQPPEGGKGNHLFGMIALIVAAVSLLVFVPLVIYGFRKRGKK
ncbi:MAG: family 10 glycosylhydrolase [Clostridia bacterium]|nr:family 10 glycosylhydrolase [Clostridia bacterium]